MKPRLLICAALILIAVTATQTRFLAINFDHYNLDSLVYLSDRIVEGEIVGARSLRVPVVDVRISRILLGTGQPGETITVAATDFFRRPIDNFGRSTPLVNGDRLFLFLIPAQPAFAFEVPGDGSVLMPVPSGMKLVVGENVYNFVQYSNPGPYVADLPIRDRTVSAQTVTQLRAAIAVSLKRALAWRGQFKNAPSSRDAEKLLALLRERRQTSTTFPLLQDAIVESATWRLARLGNPKLMLQVVSIGLSSRHQRSAVVAGLGTPEGREALLQRIGDSATPAVERRQLASLAAPVGLIYHQRTQIDNDNNVRFTPSADTDNASYIARIVRLSATVADEEVALALLSGISSTSFSPGLPQVDLDLAQATAELIKFHGAANSARIRFAIESLILRRGVTDFARLQIRDTPVLSLATLDPLETTKVPGTIFVNREETWLQAGDQLTALVLVLEAVDRSRTFVVSVEDGLRKAKPGLGLSRGDRFQLPPDIPHGRYRVFFRYLSGSDIVAESYSFETSL
jgi:hypothetical protein